MPIFSLITLASQSIVCGDWITDLDVVHHSFCCLLIACWLGGACALRGRSPLDISYVRSAGLWL